jgi:hypothetical protein
MLYKTFAAMLSGLLVWASLVSQVSAAIIEAGDVLSVDARQVRIEWIQTELARDEVQRAMTNLGVDPLEAQNRVASLSDQELVELQQQLHTLPAGGDSFFALVGVVFVILIILELVGVINIFNKT